MIKKISFFILLSSICVLAGSTILDSVKVPVKIIRLTSVSLSGADSVYDYTGKIYYDLQVGDYDSLNIGLQFVPEPATAGAIVTPYEMTGMCGAQSFVNGINGRNYINFKCKITGKPASQYIAKITILGDKSHIEKVTDSLMALMTMQEKNTQLHGVQDRSSEDITRLGIPGYYMTNGPQGVGVGSVGNASGFPCAAAMANTFDTALIYKLGIALGKETFAKGKYMLEGPVINMVRDPRGGRNWEAFGEDPYLAAMISVAYCKGIQSVNCAAMPKHFICNDMENNRSKYSSNISERTLQEFYAMPFEYSVKEGKAWSIMSAYNKVNDFYCSDYAHGLTDILKTSWGFRGFVCSDYNSIQSTVAAANAGQDVELPNAKYFGALSGVVPQQVSTERFNDMVKRILRVKVWAGVIGKLGSAVTRFTSDLKSTNHEQLALEVAQKSIVLLKNEKFGTETTPVLPLSKTASVSVLPASTDLAGCQMDAAGSGATKSYLLDTFYLGIKNKVGAAKYVDKANWQNADVVIVLCGPIGEGEGTDRTSLGLPANQLSVINSVLAANKKCVIVLSKGSAVIKDTWTNAPAIVVAWYPGEKQGTALANVLYGDFNPSGRLSANWPVSASQLPPFSSDGNVVTYERVDTGRGYRYNDRCGITPLYSFGYGLSYTTFDYSNIKLSQTSAYIGEDIIVAATITNSGNFDGEDVPQLYIKEKAPLAEFPRAVKELKGFTRVAIAKGKSTEVYFVLHERDFAYFDDKAKRFVVNPGEFTVMVGPSAGSLPLTASLTLKSPW